jgi:hypothetical protein
VVELAILKVRFIKLSEIKPEGQTMTASEQVLKLTLQGKHQEAAAIARKVAEMYREDPNSDGFKDDGKCNDCGHVFTDGDCQHGEIAPFILCDRCYLDRGGK